MVPFGVLPAIRRAGIGRTRLGCIDMRTGDFGAGHRTDRAAWGSVVGLQSCEANPKVSARPSFRLVQFSIETRRRHVRPGALLRDAIEIGLVDTPPRACRDRRHWARTPSARSQPCLATAAACSNERAVCGSRGTGRADRVVRPCARPRSFPHHRDGPARGRFDQDDAGVSVRIAIAGLAFMCRFR